MALTKKEARALIAMDGKIRRALNACLGQLSQQRQDYANSYWAAHIQGCLDGSYGSAPIAEAEDTIDAPRRPHGY